MFSVYFKTAPVLVRIVCSCVNWKKSLFEVGLKLCCCGLSKTNKWQQIVCNFLCVTVPPGKVHTS